MPFLHLCVSFRAEGTLYAEDELKIFAQALNIQTNPISPFEKNA